MDQNELIAKLITTAVSRYAEPALSAASAAFRRLTASYTQMLAQTYGRVSTIKTLVNPNEPISLIDNFTPMTLSHRGPDGERSVSDQDFVELINKGGRFVISALAGRGKSVLLKYLALIRYHVPDGNVPIFLELRSLNELSSKDILALIHANYAAGSGESLDALKTALSKGRFVIYLDGFDEVDYDSREAVERNILDIAKRYPLTTLVVSGRPDPKFHSWTDFHIYHISPMDKGQIINLISSLHYPEQSKKKFIRLVNSTLYDSHEYFLSTPLLAILMLLTFDKYAVIPEKMHVFYENAFDTLFSQHDATKELYTRKHRTKLPIDVFKRALSVLCALTYAREIFQARESDLLEHTRTALTYCGVKASAEDFCADLIESVCIFQRDGLEISFTHRSFQEFFCALFLAREKHEVRIRYFKERSFRVHDSVLPMLFDMAPSQLESEWIIPFIDSFISSIDACSNPSYRTIELIDQGMVYALHKSTLWDFYTVGGPLWYEMMCLRRIYKAQFIGSGWAELLTASTIQPLADKLFALEKSMISQGDIRFVHDTSEINSSTKKRRRHKELDIVQNEITLEENDIPWLEDIGIASNARATIKAVKSIRREIGQKNKTRSLVMDDIFRDRS